MDEVPTRRVADYAGEDAWLPLRLRPILAEKLARGRAWSSLLDSLELPLDRRAGRVGIQRHQGRRGPAGRAEPALRPADGDAGARDSSDGGPAVEHRLAQAASRVALYRVEAAGDQADGEDRPQHRRRSVGGACPAASAAGQDSGVPAVRQAEEHVRRCPAGDDLPGDRPRPRVVPPGGGGHRPAQFQRPQPAKHPRADARRAGKSARRSCPARRAGF